MTTERLRIGHIDPAVHGHAMAVGRAAKWTVEPGARGPLVSYEPGELLAAAYAHSKDQEGRGPHVWTLTCAAFKAMWAPWRGQLDALVVEVPQAYDGPRPVDPNDLMQICGALGVVLGWLDVPLVLGRLPREWTGGGKKAPRLERAKALLTPAEAARVVPVSNKKDREDLWDAIALQKTRGSFLPLILPG